MVLNITKIENCFNLALGYSEVQFELHEKARIKFSPLSIKKTSHPKSKLIDQGGEGDCLLRSISFILSKLTGLEISKFELFKILNCYYPNLKINDWLQDEHVAFFASIFPICICIHLVYNNGKEKNIHFGDPSFIRIRIRNDDQVHYAPYDLDYNQDLAEQFWTMFLMDLDLVDDDGFCMMGLKRNRGVSQSIEMLSEFETVDKEIKRIVIQRQNSQEHTLEMEFNDSEKEDELNEDEEICETLGFDFEKIMFYDSANHKDMIDLVEPELKLNWIEFNNYKFSKLRGGACVSVESGDFKQLAYLYPYLCTQTIDSDNFDCFVKSFKNIMSELVNYQNSFFNDDLQGSGYYVKCIKDFFKFRHDILLSVFLLSIENEKGLLFGSDVPFSDHGIESNKTPDYILRNYETNQIFIFENSVSADMNKSAYQKGNTLETSIYKNEIHALMGKGLDVKWVPLFYDTTSRSNNWDLAFDLFETNEIVHDKTITKSLLLALETQVPDFRILDKLNYINFLETDFSFGKTVADNAELFLKEAESSDIIVKGLPTNEVTVAVYKLAFYSYKKNVGNMLEFIPTLRNRKYTLVLKHKGFQFVINDDGFTPLRWYNWIENEQYVTIFRHARFRGTKSDHHVVNYGDTVVVTQNWVMKNLEVFEGHDHEVPLKVDFELEVVPDYQNSYHYQPKYEENYDWKSDYCNNPDKDPKLLSNCQVSYDVVEMSMDELNKSMEEKQDTIKDHRAKNPFTMPFIDPNYIYDKDKGDYSLNVDFINGEITFDPVLSKIVKCIRDGFFKKTFNVDQKEMEGYTKARINYVKAIEKLPGGKMPKLKDMINSEKPEVVSAAKKYLTESKRFGEITRKSKASTDNSMVKPFSLSGLRDILVKNDVFAWRDKTKKSTMRGIDLSFNDESKQFVKKSLNFMQCKSSKDPLDDEILNPGVDTPEMLKLKEITMSKHLECKELYKSLNVSHMSEFVSRFYYTLLYFSQKKCNSDSFLCSNLGYKNSILVVRGGKKVWQIQKSRTYCAIFPVPDYFENHKELFSPSTMFYRQDNILYMYTGWCICNEKVLEDKSFFSFKSYSLVVNYLVRSDYKETSEIENLDNIMFNLLLAFNNRRSTESYLSSIRNLLANSMGVYSSISELISEFSVVPQDSIQLYLIDGLCQQYKHFFTEVNESVKNDFNDGNLKHLFTKQPIKGVNDLTNLLYCTYSMTRAPYEQALEQSLNLKKMMDTHEKFMDTINKDNHLSFLSTTYKSGWEVFGNEFFVDYKYSTELGKRCSGIIKAYDKVSDVHSYWHNIMNRPWTDVTTASGMRKDELKKSAGFFGKKGHEVVMEELIKTLKDLKMDEELFKLEKMSEEDLSFQKQVKRINELNIPIRDKIVMVVDKLHFVFHVVDKTQWKGMREIFVMTLYTKLVVWPLEQFFKRLCQYIDNEIISIPSNKRLSVIHSRLFEQKLDKNTVKVFLTLDCKRWGPMCVFLKYAYFIIGLADILPKSMVDIFLYVTVLYFKKEIVVSPRAWKVFSENKRNEPFLKYFKEVKDLDTATFVMPYSFIMGIFNYLSSLMHAINQIDACEKACEMVRIEADEEITFNMDAHSDDSGGIIVMRDNHNRKKVLEIAVRAYEYNLRRVNHMLSTKKCVISYKYFELLSILYVNNRLLPLVPKFFSNLEFKPTLQGFSSDISQAYSKCIELLSIGATLSEAYFNMRLYSEMVRRAYHIPCRSDKPINAYGGVYAHPLLVLLLGSMADNCRLYQVDKKLFLKYQTAVKFIGGNEFETFQQTGFKSKQVILYRNSLKKLKQEIEDMFKKTDFLKMEIFKNVDFKNTLLKPLSFYHKLQQASFVNSLNYTTNTRRLTKLFYDQSTPNIETSVGFFNNKEINELVDLFVAGDVKTGLSDEIMAKYQEYGEELVVDRKQENVFDFLFGEATHLYNYLSTSIDDSVKLEHRNMTCKPCQFNMDLSKTQLKVSDSFESIYYSDQPELFRWFGKSKDLTRDKNTCLQLLESIGIKSKGYDDFIYYLRKLESYKCELYSYGYVETNNRIITDYENMIGYLETNSIYGYKITKIFENVKLNYNLNKVGALLNPEIQSEAELLKIYTMIDLKLPRKRKHELRYKLEEEFSHYEIKEHMKTRLTFDMFSDFEIMKKNKTQKIDVRDLKYFFIWMKRSKRIGDHWLGSSEVFLMINATPLIMVIERGMLVEIKCEEYRQLSSFDLGLIELLMRNWQVKMMNMMPKFNVDIVLGIKNSKLTVDFEKNVELLIAPITPMQKDFISIFNSKKFKNTDDPSVYFTTDGSYSLKLLLSEFSVNIQTSKIYVTNIENQDFQNIGFRYLEPANSVELNKIDLIENLDKTKVYKELIFQKLNSGKQMIDHLLNLNAYVPLTKELLKNLIELNIDPDIIPDDVWKSVSTLKVNELREQNFNMLLDDMRKCIVNDNWSDFFNTWGGYGDISQVVMFGETMLMDILANPAAFCAVYPELAVSAFNSIYKFFDTKVDNKFLSILVNDSTGLFNDNRKLTKSDFLQIVIRTVHISQTAEKTTDLGSHILRYVFEKLFLHQRYFTEFKTFISNENFVKSLPVKADLHLEWCSFFVNCMEIKGKSFNSFFNYEFSRRQFYLRAKNEDSALEYKYGTTALKRYTHLNSRFFIKKEGSGEQIHKYKFTEKNYDLRDVIWYNMCYEPKVKNVSALQERKLVCEEDGLDDEFDAIDDFFTNQKMNFHEGRDQHAEDKEELGEALNIDDYVKSYKMVKKDLGFMNTSEVNNYKGKELKLPAVEIDVPFLDIIGEFNLDNIASIYGHFCVRFDCLPSDLKFQPKDRVQICLDPYNKGFNNTMLCFYNMEQDMRTLGFQVMPQKELVKYNKTHYHPRFFYSISGEIFYLDESYESRTFNQKMIYKFRNTKNKIIKMADEKDFDAIFSHVNYLKNILSWSYDEDEDKKTEDLNMSIFKLMRYAKLMYYNPQENKLSDTNLAQLQKLYDDEGYELDVKLLINNAPHLSDVALEFVAQKHMKTFSVSYMVKKGVQLTSKVLSTYLDKEAKIVKVDHNKDIFKLRFNEEYNSYDPLENDPSLSTELKSIFGQEYEIFVNRKIELTFIQRTKLLHSFSGLKATIKGSSMVVESIKKYDLFIRYLTGLIKSADIIEKRTGLAQRFEKTFVNLYDDLLIKTQEYISDEEEDEPVYLESLNTDFVINRKYYG